MMSTTTNTPQADPKKDRRIALRQLMGAQKTELVKLLPAAKVERLLRVALTECVRNPQLLACTAESWALALNACAAWGLYPDSSLGYVYLISRENRKKPGKPMEVQAMRGYQGDIQLARNTGEIADLYCEVVYEKDEYQVTKGLSRDIKHVPYAGPDDPGPLRAVYAVARLKSGETAWVDLSARDVARHRAASESASSDYSPWNKHTAAMWKKSAIRELVKWLPRASEKMEDAVAKIGTDDARQAVIDVAAAEATEIPVEGQGDALDRLADALGAPDAEPPAEREPGQDDDEAPGGVCTHPGIPQAYIDNMPEGEEKTCEKCGEVIRGPGRITREKAEKKGKAGQARLSE
jgi:recombination protein RecT